MEELLNRAGYKDVSHLYSPNFLLSKAEEIMPGCVAHIEEERRNRCKSTNWNYASPRLILSWVYGIKHLIAPQGESNPTRFAFDIAIHPQNVLDKYNRLVDKSLLWKSIGITKFGVVLLIKEGGQGFHSVSEEEVDERLDRLLNDVIFPMSEASSLVGKYILNL
jgi:hypothetical protein